MEIGKAETMNSGQGTMGSTLGAGRRALAEEVPVGYKRTEVGVIPEEWESSSVCAIASSTRNAIVGGPFGSDLVSKDYVAHGVPVIRGQNMSGRWVSGSFVFVTPTKAKSLEANLAYPGDIIFTQRGTLGQVSLVADKPFSAYLVSQSQMKLSVDRKVADPLFLFYFFISYEQQKSIQGRTIQTGVPHINLGILREMPIRLPPLAEQRAIAEALSDVDGLLAALETLIAKKRAIKQAAMLQLLTGKSRLPGFSGAWETKKISEVATYCNEKNSLAEDLPVLTCSKHLGFVDSLRYFKNQVFSKDLRGYKIIRRGQIGYPANHIEEGSIGLQDLYDVALVSPIYVVCSPKAGINSYFLHRLLKLDCYRQEFAIATTSSIDRRGSLKWSAFSELVVNLPYVDEQRAIASVLSDMDAEIASLERRRDKTRVVKQGMMQQLLTGRVRLVEFEALTKKTTT